MLIICVLIIWVYEIFKIGYLLLCLVNKEIFFCLGSIFLTFWLPRWSNMTGHGFSCDATVVIGDRSAWTSYNCKNWMKIGRWGIFNIIDKYKIPWNKKCPTEQLNIFIRTSIKEKWEQILHLTVHCVGIHIFEG